MECPTCRFDNREGAKFCKECGAKLEFTCPECGAGLIPPSKFCDECGYDLSKATKAPKVDYSTPESYTPKHLANKILTTRSSIEGERKIVTVLFADVADYTSISEKLDPEEVHQIMDGCFKIIMDEVHKYEGTINQFTGDGVMALFGAPVAHEDHVQRACHAALSIQQAIEVYGNEINKNTGLQFKMRIGINSGPVIVGAIGDDLRMDYTAVGDTTNLGSRMESRANPGAILVSANTHRLVRDFFEFNPLGEFEIKGKEAPQEAFELIKTGGIETRIGASVAKGLTRFVGRKNSMAVLLNAFDTVKSGSGQVVGLVGEAGVGKSRLLFEMRCMLPKGEYIYLEGRCLHYGSSMPYLPMLDVLRSYFNIKEGDREFIIEKKINERILGLDKKFESSIPFFKDLLSLKTDDNEFLKLEPEDKREKTFEALRSLMIRLSFEKPLILAIEDLHWIDKTSEEFIDYLIGGLANNPIFLILLYRPEYVHQWGSKSYYIKVGLTQLDIPSSSQLIQAILEDGEVAPELKKLILNRASGNPLFMEEFTHTLLENGSIEIKDELYTLSRRASEPQIPDTIQGIISARIDRLEDNLKRTMQVASVIGRDFAYRILQTITGMREELRSYLLNLQGLEFIYEKSLFPELEYIFKHALTQEVAYNSLLLKRRKEIHKKIGKAIEELYSHRLEEFYEMIAYHYSKSENLQKAAHYLKLSGIKAAGKHSPIEAMHYYQEALRVLKQLPESEENKKTQIEVCLLSFVPSVTLSFPEDYLQIYQEAEKLSNDINDERSLAHACSMICNFYRVRGESFQALEYAEKGFEIAKRTQDISEIAPAAMDLCIAYQAQGLYFKVINIAPDVLHLLEEKEKYFDFFIRAVAVYPSLCTFYGYALGMMGNFEKGAVFCKKGLHTAGEIGELRTLAWSEYLNGWFYFLKGNRKLIIEHFKNCIKYCEDTKWHSLTGYTFGGIGYGHYLSGDLENAPKSIEKGIKILQDIETRALVSRLYWLLSIPLYDSGEYEKALTAINDALILAQENNEKDFEGLSRIWLGRILAKTDPNQYDRAEESIFKGINILQELRLKPFFSQGYMYLGALYADTGQKDKALETLKKAERMFRKMGMDYWLAKTDEVLEGL